MSEEKVAKIVQEGQQVEGEVKEEVKVEETTEEKLVRYEVEREEFAKKEEDWVKREKKLSEERSDLGRRNKAGYEERQLAMEKRLSDLQTQISGTGNQVELQRKIDGLDLTDSQAVYNLIADTSKQVARQEIDNTITKGDEDQRVYDLEYERKLDELRQERGIDDETYSGIREKLKGMRGAEYAHTKIGAIDAIANFDTARADMLQDQVNETRKPLNLKQDTTTGAGVGGKGTVESSRVKPLKIGEQTKSLAATLGRDEKWLREHGIGV